ncbi:MAG: 16S rRNA (guanine(527)-N(7))-methyltransferase RsmG [Sphingomonas sp. 28-62-20]|nr:MAG: 16S rRNA (guanine(527)-N(7))-methyltransferase RsmG [Sphingomonas sp. 28-62-20]
MTEEEARSWIVERFGVSRETLVERFVNLLVAESTRQNLVSAASMDQIWRRHIVDSAQLLALAGAPEDGHWIDIGTGAGFPGMIIALLSDRPVTLIEPRRKRADFLTDAAKTLGLARRVVVHARRAEQVTMTASVISARAVAQLPELLAAAAHLSHRETLWLLPKGPSAREEVAAAAQTWHGSFHVEHSITEAGSLIITAKGVARR